MSSIREMEKGSRLVLADKRRGYRSALFKPLWLFLPRVWLKSVQGKGGLYGPIS